MAARSRRRRAGQVDIKIDEDGSWDVAGVVRGLARTPVDVPPHIRNDEMRLVQMRREPARVDKGSGQRAHESGSYAELSLVAKGRPAFDRLYVAPSAGRSIERC